MNYVSESSDEYKEIKENEGRCEGCEQLFPLSELTAVDAKVKRQVKGQHSHSMRINFCSECLDYYNAGDDEYFEPLNFNHE
jgi:uncharacterized protein with PIN domain